MCVSTVYSVLSQTSVKIKQITWHITRVGFGSTTCGMLVFVGFIQDKFELQCMSVHLQRALLTCIKKDQGQFKTGMLVFVGFIQDKFEFQCMSVHLGHC